MPLHRANSALLDFHRPSCLLIPCLLRWTTKNVASPGMGARPGSPKDPKRMWIARLPFVVRALERSEGWAACRRLRPTQQQIEVGTGTPSEEMGRFVSAILGSTEAEWKEVFEQAGKTYRPPTLVMFTGATQSGCGFAQSAMGPFYCPGLV